MGQRSRRGATPRRTDTSDPSRSRERALRVLFQADLRGVAPSVTLERLDGDPAARALLDERDPLTDEVLIIPPPAIEGDSAPGRAGRETRPASQRPAQPSPIHPPAKGEGATTANTATTDDAGPGSDSGRVSGWSQLPAPPDTPALDDFTRTLVLGVEAHRPAIEELISRYSRRWAISRMPVVDRNVLRLATYELLHETTPPAVVIDEAIDLAKRLSTDDSGRFVNGVLESIRRELAEAGGPARPGLAGDAHVPSGEASSLATDGLDTTAPPSEADADVPTDEA